MDTALNTYAAALLTGTGTDVDQITAELHTEHEPTTSAAAAVIDGWHSAETAGETS